MTYEQVRTSIALKTLRKFSLLVMIQGILVNVSCKDDKKNGLVKIDEPYTQKKGPYSFQENDHWVNLDFMENQDLVYLHVIVGHKHEHNDDCYEEKRSKLIVLLEESEEKVEFTQVNSLECYNPSQLVFLPVSADQRESEDCLRYYEYNTRSLREFQWDSILIINARDTIVLHTNSSKTGVSLRYPDVQ